MNKPVAWMQTFTQVKDGVELVKHAVNIEQVGINDIPLYTHPAKEQDGCGNCHACLVNVMEHGLPVTSQRMILCPDCGNKRCPKASNHRHQCTNSNEPNQRGSIYSHPAELTDEEIEEVIRKHWNREYKNRSMLEFARAILRKAQEK